MWPIRALVQTDRPLRPASRVQIWLVLASGSAAVGAQIVRCAVSAIRSEYGVTYCAALRVDERCSRLIDPDVAPQPGGIAPAWS